MTREVVRTDRAPDGIGPFSQAIRAGGLLFVSGQIPMDPQTREDTHNPFVIGFGIIALAMAVLGTIVLPMTIRRRKKASNSGG